MMAGASALDIFELSFTLTLAIVQPLAGDYSNPLV